MPTQDLFLVNGIERVFGQLMTFKDFEDSSGILSIYESVKDALPNEVVVTAKLK